MISNRTLPVSTADLRDAMGEWFLARSGHKPENPLVEELIERNASIADIAANFVGHERGEPDASIIDRAIGLGNSDFPNAVVASTGEASITKYNQRASGVMKIVRNIPVKNFRPYAAPSLSIGDFDTVPEFGERPYSDLQASDPLDAAAAIDSKGMLFTMTRQSLINDDHQYFAMLREAIVNRALLTITNSITAALEDTSNLDDGNPLFVVGGTIDNYVTSGAAPSVSTVNEGYGKIYRSEKPFSQIAAVEPKYLVVPPELTTTSKVLVAAVSDRQQILEVVTLPFTSTEGWYLLADPDEAPVLGLLTLMGSRSPLYIERRDAPANRDGIAISARLEYRVIRLSRHGAFHNDGA